MILVDKNSTERRIVMTNSDMLKEAVKNKGLKKTYIAQCLGISPQGYYKKENGMSEFTASEIQIMRDILGLSHRAVKDIFLS